MRDLKNNKANKKYKYSEDLEYEMEQIYNRAKDKDKALEKVNKLWRENKK